MRRKQLVAVGILSICLFASGCGSNTVSTEQGTENTVIVQETEMQETEIKEVETQEVETQETESQDVETQTPETEEIVQITGEIYQLRDTVEIRQAYMGYNMESPRVPGDADLVIEEMSDNISWGKWLCGHFHETRYLREGVAMMLSNDYLLDLEEWYNN